MNYSMSHDTEVILFDNKYRGLSSIEINIKDKNYIDDMNGLKYLNVFDANTNEIVRNVFIEDSEYYFNNMNLHNKYYILVVDLNGRAVVSGLIGG